MVGPTGVGKTEVACLVAEEIGGEIVSADSRQMYRGLDVGTDKPDKDVLKKAPHHLLDILDPSERFDAARFSAMARDCFGDIGARGKVPMLVGGSGLYVKAALFGIFPSPSKDKDLRARLEDQENETPGSLYERLRRVDPDRAAQLRPADGHRVVRALEFFELTGVRMSEAQKKWVADGWPHLAVGLTRPRWELYRRIDLRVTQMFEKGLLEEVRSLLERGVPPDSPGLASIGYEETLRHLEGDLSRDEMVALIQRNSRRYAKRQVTWFKRMPLSGWISPDDAPRAASEVVALWRGEGG
jgi:tRNA dimethylallyltransferase